jgi:tRNA-2-methylthio-N6-dimethylallyladenosine synthase
MDVMAKYKNICNHLHLPVQSGSDEILKRMNRGYTTDQYRHLVAELRKRIPEIVLSTDLIVGFPGETEEQFMETLRFAEEMVFDQIYTFIYSRRSGTRAAEFEDQIPEELKKERHYRLSEAQDKIGLAQMKLWENKVTQVLVDGPTKNDDQVLCGRNAENKLILWPKEDGGQVGDLIDVRVDKAQTFILKGRALI